MDNFVCLAFQWLVILLVSINTSSYSSSCFGEYCFTYPGADVTRSFDGAESWCATNDSSTLAVVRNKSFHDALIQFLSLSNIPSPLYINAKLDKNNGNTWYLINGDKYPGNVENQMDRDKAYKFYTSLQILPQFAVRASSPQELKNYICKYKNNSGIDILPNTNYSDNGMVYVKYEIETLNWFEARNRCYLKGGDLATFVYLTNTNWLNLSLSYWIGFRWNNWRWESMGDNQELIYTRWSNGKPNDYTLECVCIDEMSSWNWTDCDCSTKRPFVCAKYKGVSTATSATTTLSSSASFHNETSVNRSAENSNRNSIENFKLAVGVGVGVGGGVLIIVVVVVIIIVIKTRKSKQGTTNPNQTRTAGKPQKEPKKPTNPKDTKMIQLTSNFAQYAEILAISQPGLREPANEPIVYATPEFVETNGL